jgi:hypothetical protein
VIPNFRHVREVRRTQFSRLVLLTEVHLLRRTFGRPPDLDPPLQRPDLSIAETAGMFPLEPLKKRLGFQPVILFDQLPHLLPDFLERVLARPPSAILLDLAG